MRQNRLIGRQVAGRFTIKSFLGEGGMATVFIAEQSQEPREVALKIMSEDLSADRTFVKRFQREAKAAARVQHPNSVALIDYGVADGLSYIAMELLRGDDLYVLLEHEGAVNQGRAARILIEVCDALMVAHELGIVHRDLKPENIMVIPDPSHPNGERVKVLDFGIAKLLAPDTTAPVDPRLDPASAVTRAGTFIGTPAYMSPEQCALLPVDTRADIYTCGVLLFQLVTGRLPFEGQTPLHTATLHIHEPPPRPSQYAPQIDPRLEAVIMKALAKKPTERHQTARHLATTLRKLLPDLVDINVSQVKKPHVASMRPPGKTRSQLMTPPPPAAGEAPIESAKTMVAHGSNRPPPAVVLRDGPPSSELIDSSPARIRPAAGAPPAPPIPRADEDEADADSDDSMRTLVRAPEEETRPRTGPQHTEVIMTSGPLLPVPPAPPPPTGAKPATLPRPGAMMSVSESEPTKPRVQINVPANALDEPAKPDAAPAAAGPKPPRIIKPTLKSAAEFQPSSNLTAPTKKGPQSTLVGVAAPGAPTAAAALAATPPAPAEPEAKPVAVEVNEAPKVPVSRLSDPGVPPTEGERPSKVVVKPAGFNETAKIDTSEALSLASGAGAGGVNPTAQTVPLISAEMVASVLAAGPRPAAGAPPPSAPALSGGAPSAPSAPAVQTYTETAKMEAPILPQTPPVYPMMPPGQAPPPAAISGTRGLVIGFVAGAFLMGLCALAYLFFIR